MKNNAFWNDRRVRKAAFACSMRATFNEFNLFVALSGWDFRFPEIRELLVIEREEGETCSHVRELLQAKLAQIHSKVEELRLLEGQLTKRLRKCERKLNASGDSHKGRCPVLDEIGRGSHEN